jgi:hypothetical protein
MIPTLIEVQTYFFDKGDRNTKSPLQFFAYYNSIGWPDDWKKQAQRYLAKNR